MWERIKTIFKEANESSFSNPIMHNILARSQSNKEEFIRWKDNGYDFHFFEWLKTANKNRISHATKDDHISFLDTPSKKGFVIFLNKFIPIRNPEHIMDAIKERIQGLGYKVYVSDEKSYNSGVYIETLQRHYLKPPLNFEPDTKLSQLYGNISIELVLQNDHPKLLKFSTTTYQDHMFTNADTFDNLIQRLCDND